MKNIIPHFIAGKLRLREVMSIAYSQPHQSTVDPEFLEPTFLTSKDIKK